MVHVAAITQKWHLSNWYKPGMNDERSKLLLLLSNHNIESFEIAGKERAYIAMKSVHETEHVVMPFIDALRSRGFDTRHTLEHDLEKRELVLTCSKSCNTAIDVEKFFKEIRQTFELAVSGGVENTLFNYSEAANPTDEFIVLEKTEQKKTRLKKEKTKEKKRGSIKIKESSNAVKKEKGESKLKKSIFNGVDMFFAFFGLGKEEK